jgi:hypothetical protein
MLISDNTAPCSMRTPFSGLTEMTLCLKHQGIWLTLPLYSWERCQILEWHFLFVKKYLDDSIRNISLLIDSFSIN